MVHLTSELFDTETIQSPLPVVVMFYAGWCPKCAMMKPVTEEIEKRHQDSVKFCEIDIEQSPELAAAYEADIIPTFLFLNHGKVVGIMQGIIDEHQFEQRLQRIFRNS